MIEGRKAPSIQPWTVCRVTPSLRASSAEETPVSFSQSNNSKGTPKTNEGYVIRRRAKSVKPSLTDYGPCVY